MPDRSLQIQKYFRFQLQGKTGIFQSNICHLQFWITWQFRARGSLWTEENAAVAHIKVESAVQALETMFENVSKARTSLCLCTANVRTSFKTGVSQIRKYESYHYTFMHAGWRKVIIYIATGIARERWGSPYINYLQDETIKQVEGQIGVRVGAQVPAHGVVWYAVSFSMFPEEYQQDRSIQLILAMIHRHSQSLQVCKACKGLFRQGWKPIRAKVTEKEVGASQSKIDSLQLQPFSCMHKLTYYGGWPCLGRCYLQQSWCEGFEDLCNNQTQCVSCMLKTNPFNAPAHEYRKKKLTHLERWHIVMPLPCGTARRCYWLETCNFGMLPAQHKSVMVHQCLDMHIREREREKGA